MKIPLLLSFIAGLSTVIGSFLIFLNIKKVGEFIVFSLSFSLGIMTFISIFDLIPSSLLNIIKNYGIYYGIILSILTLFLGYLSINKVNNQISKKNSSSLYKIGILSMISLMMHNIPEGIAVFMGAYTDISLGIKLCTAIIMHNIPEGIAISIPLYYSKVGKKKTLFYTLISGLSEPFGAIITYIFLKKYINTILLSYILLFTAGLMISLSLNDILKEIKKYNKDKYIIYGLLCSLFLSCITLFL